MIGLKIAQEDYFKEEARLIEEKEKLVRNMVEVELAHEEELRRVQKEHSEQLFGLRTEFMRKLEEMAVRCERRLQTIRTYYEVKNKTEIAQITESKNDIIHSLLTNHNNDISEIRSYFKGINDNNIPLIAELKDELKQFKTENNRLKNIIEKIQKENKTISVPLEEAKERVKILEKRLKEMEDSKMSLLEMRKRYKSLQQKLDEALAEKDQVELSMEKVETEKEGIKRDYATMVVDIKKKSSMEITKLEKHIIFLEKDLERKEIQLSQLIQKTSIEPKSLMYATNKLQQAMMKNKKKMEKLQVELCKAVKAHDTLLGSYSATLEKYGVPKSEIREVPYQPILKKIISELLSDRQGFFASPSDSTDEA